MAKVINQIKYDGIEYALAHSAYAECATAASTQAKVANLVTDGDTTNNGFTLIKGVTVNVKFTYTNSAASPTLNVQSSGAKSIYYKGAAVPVNFIQANRTYTFVYDSTNWNVVGDITAVTNSSPTLAWSTKSTVGTVDGVALEVTMPAAKYHTTGSWSGLTYTATNQGSASALAFTLPTGTTSTTVSRGDHTHTTSIASSTGTNELTLAHGSKYAITAGGDSFVFTMPSSGNTDTKVTQAYSTGNASYPLLLCATSGVSSTSSRGATTAIVNNQFYANPSTGYLTAKTVSAVTFIASSDKRLKENIIEYVPEHSILDLPVYKYNFTDDAAKIEHIGCLAQDLQTICPEIVSEGDNGYLSINESKIVYLLLDEVKKLKAEVKELKAKI